MMTHYRTDDGSEITGQMIDKWADEAERIDVGEHVDGLEVTPFEGRLWEHHARPMTARTIRLPETTWRLIRHDAHEQHISVNEWVRRAVNDALLKNGTGTV